MSYRKLNPQKYETNLLFRHVLSLLVFAIVASISQAEPVEDHSYDNVQSEDVSSSEEIEIEQREEGDKLPALVFILLSMGFVIVVLAIIFGVDMKANRNRHETIRKYLELGKEVPPELLVRPDDLPKQDKVSDLKKGIIWLFMGLGLALCIWVMSENSKAPMVAAIPFFIGVGYIVSAKIEPQASDTNT